ncbi:D-2-hydroxyacid dehydrogenase [Ruegeria sp.]|uniref:D-2-hydroxyacid dehydrogenase n=1 Tax=Ruegeria sp. TaxID=1879320 RepID=UPI002314A6A3|nr:D-2-hydroxyacid dehydrogenase [Ruegeria sp.]MDA7965576.1 D-2-hydroxyacid dehydrogenase [Ruegeria sp.]
MDRRNAYPNVTVYHPDPETAAEYYRVLGREFPELNASVASDPETLAPMIPDTEILVCFRPPVEALKEATSLKWIHYVTAGVDALLPARNHLQGVTVTNFAGRPSVADYAMGAVLMLHWNVRKLIDDQRAGVWDHFKTPPLEEFTVGVIGLGSIGQDIARRATGFGMTVLGMRRSARATPHVDQVYAPDQLADFLPRCDFVVLALPGTDGTRQFLGADAFRLMKDSAFLINVGRGDIVDQAALIEALQSGQIAGAALDVFEQEPLPKVNPLWAMENVILSPHIAGATSRYVERVVTRFGEALEHYQRGEDLPHSVNLKLGY